MKGNVLLLYPDDHDFEAQLEIMVAKSHYTFRKPLDIVWVDGAGV